MTTYRDIYSFISEKFPRTLSSSWDNDGLMVCPNIDKEAKKVLISLDVTAKVAEYAKENGFDLILSHHPLVFKPIRQLSCESPNSKIATNLFASGISVMSFHTRFDAGEGGMNDVLSAKLGLKVVGKFGEDGDDLGRICELDKTIPFSSLCNLVKDKLGTPNLFAVPWKKEIKKVAILGGGGGSYIESAAKAGADALITGSVSYNALLDADQIGISVIAAGHYYTEEVFCDAMKELLQAHFSDIKIEISPVGCEVIYI
jgi:dinuclear metal center YbgI/SA1388 family protein